MSLSPQRIAALLMPYLVGFGPGSSSLGSGPLSTDIFEKLEIYLDLLLRWNVRTNLTAIREPEMIVRRHFGESLFLAAQLEPRPHGASSLLDFGSGAGFPGLPVQIAMPDLHVTLAESQCKKVAFLREVVRALGLRTTIWADRVESLPVGQQFDMVALRAVDRMQEAVACAQMRVKPGGQLALFASGRETLNISNEKLELATRIPLPESLTSYLEIYSSR